MAKHFLVTPQESNEIASLKDFLDYVVLTPIYRERE